MYELSRFSASSSTLTTLFLTLAILVDVKCYFTVVLAYIPLKTKGVEHLFMCLLAICMSSLKNCPFEYFTHLKTSLSFYCWIVMRRVDSLEKTLMLGGIWGQEEKGTTEDEMAGWHHWLDARESGWTPGVGDGQGGLACGESWGRKESDTTERLNWTEELWGDVD